MKPNPIGRPPREKKASLKRLAVRLSDAEHKAYSAAAKRLGRTISEFARIAMEKLAERLP